MLYLPQHFPAIEELLAAGHDIREYALRDTKSYPTAGRRVLLLNLMPHKEVTDLDISRTIASTGEDVILMPMKIARQTYKTTPKSYVDAFYLDFEDYSPEMYDGMIITGAPVEHLPFGQVRYWPQLCQIMDWARGHVSGRLYICWGAQAGLFHLYGIPKHPLPHKRFGIYQQTVQGDETCKLLQGMPPAFPMPHSRHTEVRSQDFLGTEAGIVAASDESGVSIATGNDGRDVFVLGHLEYAPDTLDREYHRDMERGLPIAPPIHYYISDDPSKGINYSWQTAAVCFYANWLRSLV